MLIRIVCLLHGLLPHHVLALRVRKQVVLAEHQTIRAHLVQPFLLFSGALFEEDLAQHFLLLLVGVVVLHVVVVRLVKDGI